MHQKKITEIGTQQLLMDIYSLKTVLTHLHNLGMPADGSPTARTVSPPGTTELYSLGLGFKGGSIPLFFYTVGVLFHVKCCVRQLALIFFYHALQQH